MNFYQIEMKIVSLEIFCYILSIIWSAAAKIIHSCLVWWSDSDLNFKIKRKYSQRAKKFEDFMKNLSKIGLDEVSSNKVLRSSVTKTQ